MQMLARAESLRCPIVGAGGPGMSRLVKYDPNRATDLGARCDKCHHRPASSVSLNDETLASATNICLAIRCLRAKLSCDRIPSFGPGMAVFGGDIARVRDAFGILRRVLFTRFHHDRSDLGHTYTPARPPAGLANSEKPDLPKASTTVLRGPFADSASIRFG